MENKINYEEILTSLIKKERNITGKDIREVLVKQGYMYSNGKLLPIDELPFKVGDYVVRITDSKVIYKVTGIDYINGFFYLDHNNLPFEISRRNEFSRLISFKKWDKENSHIIKWIEDDIKKLYANNMKSQSLYDRELDFLESLKSRL